MSAAVGAEPEFHAQFDEDRILAEIFAGCAEGYCVEVGAYDGRTGSASYHFERRGWHCLLIEPIPACAEEIRKHRSAAVVNCAASSREGEAVLMVAENVEQMSTLDPSPEHLDWIKRVGGELKEITVRTATLDSLLGEAGFPELQFVTIDVEGHELAVLQGFTLEDFRPRVVIIEDNSVRGDPRVTQHMAARGYVHFRRTGVNEWYAHESDSELIRPDEIRSFERAKRRERWTRRRKHVINRIATRGGSYVPAPAKRLINSVLSRDVEA